MTDLIEQLPLPPNPSFDDLIFTPHSDGRPGHLHALHQLDNRWWISVTRGGSNDGTPEAPYEMMVVPNGETHAPLTQSDVTALLRNLA
jgi:hypothetical protein